MKILKVISTKSRASFLKSKTLRLQKTLLYPCKFFVILFFCLPIFSFSQLTNKTILSNSLKIKLPVDFVLMDEQTASKKYPVNNKPTEVYTNAEATVNIAFKKTDKALKEEKVLAEGKQLETQLLQNNSLQKINSTSIKTTTNNIFIISFYSNAIDTKIYNVMFVFSLKGKMIMGSFNCTYLLQSQWENKVTEIIKSIANN